MNFWFLSRKKHCIGKKLIADKRSNFIFFNQSNHFVSLLSNYFPWHFPAFRRRYQLRSFRRGTRNHKRTGNHS